MSDVGDGTGAVDRYLDALLHDEDEPGTGRTGVDPGVPAAYPSTDRLTPPPLRVPSPPLHAPPGVDQERGNPNAFLLFRVCGLSLAIPQDGALALDRAGVELLPPARTDPRLLGRLRRDDATIEVVDTAALVIPRGRQTPSSRRGTWSWNGMVVLPGGRWALASDAPATVREIDPRDIRRRLEPGARPWLAGTVPQHRIAVLDPASTRAFLESGLRS